MRARWLSISGRGPPRPARPARAASTSSTARRAGAHARPARRTAGERSPCSSSTAGSASRSIGGIGSGIPPTRHRHRCRLRIDQGGAVAAHVSADKVEVIYSGTDLDRVPSGVDGCGIRRRARASTRWHQLITQVGIRSWRGNDDVLDAMDARARAAPRARLLFVGAPPPRIASTLDKARRLAARAVSSSSSATARRPRDSRGQRSRRGRLLRWARPHRLAP